MENIQKKRRIFGSLATALASILTLALVFSYVSTKTSLLGLKAENDYKITLNSSNKVTSAGDHVQKTKLGNDVTFTYSNVANSTSGHVTLNSTGTLANKDHIRSVQSITATFSGSGSLKFKTSYGGDVWNGETQMESGYTYDLGTNPYFLSFKAYTNSVTIESLVITYSCVENPAAHEGEDVGDGLLGVIDFWSSSNAGDTNTSTLVDKAYVTAHSYDSDDASTRESKTLVSSVSASYTYQKRYGGIGLSSGNNAATFTLTLASGISPISVTVIAGSQSPSKTLTLNDSGKSVTKNCTGITALNDTYTDTLTWEFNSAQSELEFTTIKSSKLAIYRIYLYGESGPSYEAPEETIIGFTATDSKASSLYHDDVYDTANNLVVRAQKTGGTSVALSKGGADGYSYVVKNSNNEVINSAQPFGSEGIYTVIVSYKNYIPVEIQLTVGFHVYLTEIEVVSEHTIFNTSDKLSDYTSGITANLTYNLSSENVNGVAYADFASKGIALILLNPNGVSSSVSSVFGTDGTWTIKVASTSNASVYDTIEITVNPVLVTEISVTGSSTTLQEEATLQLSVNVLPNDATNKTVTWSSNHENIATVNTNGLVTGVSVGEARIIATAKDGSGIYGYTDITVTKKPNTVTDTITLATTGASGTTYSSWSGKTGNSGAVYAGQNAGGNDAIQLRSNGSDSGIVTTTSGGSIAKIVVAWNSNTSSGRTLNIYGKSSAYSSASDLYGSNSGTLLGTISYGSETELTISGKYEYVGVRSSSGALYLDQIQFIWGEPEQIYPTSITLTGNSSIGVGDTSQLTVNYSPADTNVKSVTFESSKTNVATVSAGGLVTGVASGTTTITAKAATENGTTSATLDITVSNISVTGVSLNKNTLSLAKGETEQLTASITPANATNKAITWSVTNASPSGCVTVSNGLVSAVAEGTANVKVTTIDGGFTATCAVTVTATSSTISDVINNAATSSDLGNTGTSSWGDDFSITLTSGATYYIHSMGTKNTSNALQWNTKGYLYSTVSGGVIKSVTGEFTSGKTLSVYGSNTAFTGNDGGTLIGTLSPSSTLDFTDEYEYILIKGDASSTAITSITIEYGSPDPVDPQSITINPTTKEIAKGDSAQLSVTYNPKGANQHLDVTWSRFSGSSSISVNSTGLVSVANNATVGATAVIRATLNYDSTIYSECTVTVVESTQDDQTILVYLCGSDLESDGQTNASKASGYATTDISEILSVDGQPDDVNIVLQTGGAKCWKSTYGITAANNQRYHVSNKALSKDNDKVYSSYKGMGKTSTLQDFITWGIQTYPAERVSLILWNHGGAMHGVCSDEKDSNDTLSNSEVKAAVANTFTTLGRDTSKKLEWIGYDACLMSVQDIAEFNSTYFKYMVASEESEAGIGWDYDSWVDVAYAKSPTETILTAIVDGFISATNDLYSDNNWGSSDQTLAWLDLSYMSAYKSAWENMASAINPKINTYGAANFRTLMSSAKSYGDTVWTYSQLQQYCEDYGYSSANAFIQGYDMVHVGNYYYDYGRFYFGTYDAYDVLTKIGSTSAFSSCSTQINAAKTAFNNLVGYSKKGSGAGNSNGLCCFFAQSNNAFGCDASNCYSSTETNFTNWSAIVTSYGS